MAPEIKKVVKNRYNSIKFNSTRYGYDYSNEQEDLNGILDGFIKYSELPTVPELLYVCRTFNNNFDITREFINNEYALSEELILRVCIKILTVFNRYNPILIIKNNKYSEFKENIDKIIHIYNSYEKDNPDNPDNPNNSLITAVVNKLEKAAEEVNKKAQEAKDLNIKLDNFFRSSKLHTVPELLHVCEKFNNNFNITRKSINNKYKLSKDLILRVCKKILTVFNNYKIDIIKDKYSEFKENIDKIIHIYKSYEKDNPDNDLITDVVNKLEEAAEEVIKKAKDLNIKLDNFFRSSKLHTVPELLDVCKMFINNFDITSESINNKYELSKDLILRVCIKILTVFNKYNPILIIKDNKYSEFKENIDKIIHIYNSYEKDNPNNSLITAVENKLKIGEEAEKYNDLFDKLKINLVEKTLIINKAKEAYITSPKSQTDETVYITQFIEQFIEYHNQENNISNSVSNNLLTFNPDISGGRKLYHRKRKSSRKKKSRRNIKSTKRRHSKRIKRHSKRRHSKKK